MCTPSTGGCAAAPDGGTGVTPSAGRAGRPALDPVSLSREVRDLFRVIAQAPQADLERFARGHGHQVQEVLHEARGALALIYPRTDPERWRYGGEGAVGLWFLSAVLADASDSECRVALSGRALGGLAGSVRGLVVAARVAGVRV